MSTDDELIARWIEHDPRYPWRGGVRIVDRGVNVWALIVYLGAAEGDTNRVVRDFDLPEEAVRAAVAYYRKNKDAIDAMIEMTTASST